MIKESKRWTFTLCVLFKLSIVCVAQQNLVPNSSFEEFSSCPDQLGQITKATDWFSERMTPDYFNSCNANIDPNGIIATGVPSNFFGNKLAANGEGYSGIVASWYGNENLTECIGVQLTTDLQIGTKYFVSFKVFLAQKANTTNWCGIDKIGALFTTSKLDSITPATLCNCPQVFSSSIITDTLNWTRISGSFIADSNYNYVGIGRFFDDSSTNSIQIAGSQCNAYYYIDDVCVSTDSSFAYNYEFNGIQDFSNSKNSITCYPNPFATYTTFQFSRQLTNATLTIYNCFGQLVAEINNIYGQNTEFSRGNLDAGIYLIQLKQENEVIVAGKFTIVDK